MSISIAQVVHEYTDFTVEGKKVHVPYCMVKQPDDVYNAKRVTRTTKFKHFAGKGTPSEIKATLLQSALEHNFDLKKATPKQIHQFMLDQGIGIDCSGFVYNVLDQFLQKNYGQKLDNHIVLFPGIKGFFEKTLFFHKRVRRCSAKTLTSALNTVEVKKVKDIQPGDMIRFTLPTWHGKHIGIIVSVRKNEIIYAHSSERTTDIGPHLAKIQITNPNKGLESQKWLEKLHDGKSYQNFAFHPEEGDSVRRLKFLALAQL